MRKIAITTLKSAFDFKTNFTKTAMNNNDYTNTNPNLAITKYETMKHFRSERN